MYKVGNNDFTFINSFLTNSTGNSDHQKILRIPTLDKYCGFSRSVNVPWVNKLSYDYIIVASTTWNLNFSTKINERVIRLLDTNMSVQAFNHCISLNPQGCHDSKVYGTFMRRSVLF